MSETELLARVWSAPENRATLRVYADWLADHGQETRAEYMQLGLLESPTPAQDQRREALRKQHRGAWLGPARPYVHTWIESETSPGFLARVRCNPAKLAAGFDAIRALGPRLVVSVQPATTRAQRELLASLPLGALYGIALHESDLSWVTDRLITLLAPRLIGLRQLELSISPRIFTADSWRMLLATVTTIDQLDFACHGSPEPWILELLASPLAARLQTIGLPRPRDAALSRRVKAAFAGRTLAFTSQPLPYL